MPKVDDEVLVALIVDGAVKTSKAKVVAINSPDNLNLKYFNINTDSEVEINNCTKMLPNGTYVNGTHWLEIGE